MEMENVEGRIENLEFQAGKVNNTSKPDFTTSLEMIAGGLCVPDNGS